jgi:hypothetical protein
MILPAGYVPAISRFTVVLLIVTLALQTLPRLKQYDKIWFDARAVAESVKSASWRFMMGAEPYASGLAEGDAEVRFSEDLSRIRSARPGLEGLLAGLYAEKSEFPEAMERIRGLSFRDRKERYIQHRLLDQRKWYENKAKQNRDAANLWFWIVWATQGLAVVTAIVQLGRWQDLNAVPVFMTLIASFLAWTQAKRFEELVHAYGLAAQELRALEGHISHVSEGAFGEYVNQVEEAISREHTMWYVRRGGTLFARP